MKPKKAIKPVKGWAVALSIDDNFIPDFSVDGFAYNVLQIHSDKKSAQALARSLKSHWIVTPVLITPLK